MKTQRMIGIAIGELDRCNMELKSMLNHSEDLKPNIVAEIQRIYSELGALYEDLSNLEEEL